MKWSFFASYHGKNEADGHSGTVKTLLRRTSKLERRLIRATSDIVEVANTALNTSATELDTSTLEEIDRGTGELKGITLYTT